MLDAIISIFGESYLIMVRAMCNLLSGIYGFVCCTLLHKFRSVGHKSQ